jgi:hypothetical protein
VGDGPGRSLQRTRGSVDLYRPPLWARASGFTLAREFNRAVKDPDLGAERAAWSKDVAKASGRSQRAETIGRAYDGAITRAVRIEAKAVGLLQVIAIGFALVALIVDRHSIILQALSLLAIVYLVLATLGTFQLLQVRAQNQVVSAHALDPTAGLLETALAAVTLEHSGPRAANSLTGVLRDLKVGFGAAVVALLLTVAGAGGDGLREIEPSPDPVPSTILPSTTTPTPTKPSPLVTTSTPATGLSEPTSPQLPPMPDTG